MEKFEELFRQNPSLERLLRPDANELEGLTDSIQVLRVMREDVPESPEINFQLAAALISHSRHSYIEEGVHLMETLVYRRWQANWSDVVGRSSLLSATTSSADTPAIARGVALAHATAPPPSEDDENSLADVSDDSGLEGSMRKCLAPSFETLNTHVAPITATAITTAAPAAVPRSDQSPVRATCDVAHATVSEDPTVINRECEKDADVSKIRPGRIDDLGLYHYYLTIGWIKLKEMDKAAACVKQMLLIVPGNRQGLALQTYLEVAARQGAAVDVATVAGVSVALASIATLAGVLLRGKQNSS